MRHLRANETVDVEPLAPFSWRSAGDAPGFIFDAGTLRGTFACFLLGSTAAESPTITFDRGSGFTDLFALKLKSFPFAFYHLPTERIPDGGRLQFHPSVRRGTFRFVAFQTSNAIVVAVLHYLFNLRYQGIGISGPKPAKSVPRWQRIKGDARRIATFFSDVGKGRGLRVQEGGETLADLKLALSLKTPDVQRRVARELADSGTPLLSFVTPTYDTPPDFLRELVESFVLQAAPYAELILSDDGSTNRQTIAALDVAGRPGVRVLRHTRNRGIAAATNAGIAAAKGKWIALLDHDDVLVEGAAAVVADAIMHNPEAHFFYTDEMVVDRALKPIGLFCKPAFDSVWLSGANYINHLSVYRRDRLLEKGGFRDDRQGSQDYDLLLRYLAGVQPGDIVHVPFVAYLWRRQETTYSHVNLQGSVENARRALRDAYCNASAIEPARDASFHRVRFAPRELRVSVVIANRDSPELIARVVQGLLERTSYQHMEIVIVDNGTTDASTLAYYRSLVPFSVTIDIRTEPFNFAAMCNRGARLAKGDALLFLNNDIEIVEQDWLGEMVECLEFAAAGIVGARLLYPNGSVQHNGVIVGLGDAAGHWYTEAPANDPGPMGRFTVRQTLSAVTAACMLVTRACFEALGGFDADAFAIAYNDVDLCLRARLAGFRTIWTPFATLIHHESLSRGRDDVGPNHLRFRAEMERLQARHGTPTFIDDAYSPLYDRRDSRPHVMVPADLPAVRPSRFP